MTAVDSVNSAQAGMGSIDAVERRAIRRVTARLIPFILLCYFISFLDRVNVSFAALQMNRDLGFSGAIYGLGAGLFFVSYCLFEVPSNLLLYRYGPARWIARIMLTWGICAVGMAFVVGPTSFYAMRLLLGAAEAGFFPGILFFLTLWFPTAYRGRILGYFLAGVAISGVIGSPLSGFLLTLDGLAGFKGWQWLYIIEGVPAIILAPIALFYLQDHPGKARWLPEAERDWLTSTLQREKENREKKKKHSVWQALFNGRVLLLAAFYFSNVCLLNGVLFFLPLMLKGFGLSTLQTGVVAALPSLLALVAVIWWGRRSDAKRERYGHASFANLVAGLALLASVLIADPTTRIVLICITSAATLAFTPPFWSIPASFLSGAAAATGIAAISSLGVLGGFFAPSIIGYLGSATGDFRFGLGGVALLALAMSVIFYFVGRKWGSDQPSPERP